MTAPTPPLAGAPDLRTAIHDLRPQGMITKSQVYIDGFVAARSLAADLAFSLKAQSVSVPESARSMLEETANKLVTYTSIYTGDKQAKRLINELRELAANIVAPAAPLPQPQADAEAQAELAELQAKFDEQNTAFHFTSLKLKDAEEEIARLNLEHAFAVATAGPQQGEGSIDSPEFIKALDGWYLNNHNPDNEAYRALIAYIDSWHSARLARTATPDVETAINGLVAALQTSKGWMYAYANSIVRDAIARTAAPSDTGALKNLLDALQPVLDAHRVSEEDSMSSLEPDSYVIFTGSGSWAKPVNVTRGHLRSLETAAWAITKPKAPSEHPDDLAVDRFAAAMRAKMAKQRAKGYGGWDDPAQCTDESLADKLMTHTQKGDPVDVANFAMMLHQRHGGDTYIVGDVLKIAALDFARRVAAAWLPETPAPSEGLAIPTANQIAEDLAAAKRGATCPMCGWDRPHEHTPREIIIYRNGIKWGVRNGNEPWPNDQGPAQDERDDAARTRGEVGAGENEHHEHRAGQPNTDRADIASHSGRDGVSSDREIRTPDGREGIDQPRPVPVEAIPTGTFECPICGVPKPHRHDESETIRFHWHRVDFETFIESMTRLTGSANNFFSIGQIEISESCYRLGAPAQYARGKMEWAERTPCSDGYQRKFVQTFWEIYKDGIRAAHAKKGGAA